MTKGEVALSFVRYFCEGRVQALQEILAEDFRFEGPFLSVNTREAYLASLEADPPEPAEFELLRMFEDGDDVCLIYGYRKGVTSVLMAQWTRFRDRRIKAITLVFDGRGFEGVSPPPVGPGPA